MRVVCVDNGEVEKEIREVDEEPGDCEAVIWG